MAEISIVEFRPEWTAEFESIAAELRDVVKDDVARIDHIDSTAVPGLAAKDIIDVQLTVAQLEIEQPASNLRAAGYRPYPDYGNDVLVGFDVGSPELRKIFFRERPGQRRTPIHIREGNRLNQEYALLFRDYLRAETTVRDAYGVIKKELADRFADDVDAYCAIKDPHMDTVYHAAKLWAKLEHWKQDDDFR